MDFRLTAEQQEIQQKAAKFAAEYLAPNAAKWGREEIFPAEACQACAQHGLTGLTVPKAFGGPGASSVAYGLTILELAAGCSSTAVTIAVSSMVAETIGYFGTPEQKEKYLPALLDGTFVSGSFALSEPSAGSDAGSLGTKCVVDGNDFVLNGEKTWISSGTHSGVFVVWVRTGDQAGTKGISTVLVEPGDPGFRIGRKEEKMGLRASSTVSLHFDDCRIPRDRMFGVEGKGFRIAMKALDGGRIGVSAQALGIARAALETTHRYYREKGIEPTGEQRARIAQMETEWQAAKLLMLQAAWLKDQKRDFSAKAAMSKAYCTETANRVCQTAVDLLGEEGCTDAYPVERLMRDVKVTTIYEGTSEVQRIVISRSLLRD